MQKGDTFNLTFAVTPAVQHGFIELFKDKNPLHTDKAFAVEKGFESEVMHGNILNGFLSYFVGECLPVKEVIIQTQEIKFLKPVYLNDELLFEAVIVDRFDSVNMVEIKFVFKKANTLKVASGKLNIGII